ncbi:hypothetical protein [Methylobacterium indicum]|uniref:Uncharacterized protein n=1 Tax=Methylobacterium indicum TaxID=1775910 RepID=A0A8H8X0C6_9HYPH|nr:hypothetical protein [Methylobacterium indicum]BCM87788.1 hypothetical protein mvi_62490 [Methylobacterium indicum]
MIEPHHSATYYPDVVDELALAMRKFLDAGMTSTQAQASIQAYATIRAAEISANRESFQRSLDRHHEDFQGRMSRNDKRVR